MSDTFRQWLAAVTGQSAQHLLTTIAILLGGIIAVRIITRITEKALANSHLEKAAHSLILSIVKIALYVLLGLCVASALGVDITGLVALASVLTLSVSLALQNMLTNMIGGFTLLNTHPFRSGDFVEVGGFSGTVTEISMSYTRLTTPDNKLVSIPNAQVVASQIVNYTAGDCRRVELTVSASYASPVPAVLEALLEAAQADKALTDPAPFAGVSSYNDSAISYVLRVWAKNDDYWDVYFAVNQRIKEVFDKRGIEMTYPHLNVHMDR